MILMIENSTLMRTVLNQCRQIESQQQEHIDTDVIIEVKLIE